MYAMIKYCDCMNCLPNPCFCLFQRDELSANQGKKQKMQETINSKSLIKKYEVASMLRFLMLKVFHVRVIKKKIAKIFTH